MGCLQSYLRPPNSPVESGGLPPAPPPSSAALSAAVAESEDAGQAAHLVASNYESPQQKDGAHGKPRTHQPGRRHGALPALAPTPSPRHSEPSPSRTTPRRSFASTAADALHHITPRVLASPGGFAGFFFGGDPIPGFEELDYDPDPSVLRSGVMDTSGIMPVRPRRIYSESLARYLLAPASPQNKKREPSPHPPSRRFSGVPSAPEVPPTPPQCPLLAPDLRECLKDSGGLLSLLTAMESEVLAAAMTRVVCKAGQALLAAGQDSPDMFLVESGAFSLLEYHGRDQQNGAEGPSPLNPLGLRGRGGNVTRGGMSQVLCGRGACFGESNLVVPSSGSKTVACGRNGGVVWTISHQRYRRVMAKESLRVRRAALRALGGVPLLHQLTEQQLRKVSSKTGRNASFALLPRPFLTGVCALHRTC
jgi:CRP-like cAMP-binding protein